MKNYYKCFRKETRKHNTRVFYTTMDEEEMKCPNT